MAGGVDFVFKRPHFPFFLKKSTNSFKYKLVRPALVRELRKWDREGKEAGSHHVKPNPCREVSVLV